MPSDPEVILNALAGGMTIRMAAKQFDVPEAEVREILKEAVERCYDGERLRETWMLEDRRLAAVSLKFYHRAMEGDGDPQSAVVFIKASERRAVLAGANMPQSHVLQVVSTPSAAETSTDRIEAAPDRICGVTPRQRELEHKQLYSDEKLSVDEQAELDQLRAEREAKRIAKLDRPGSEPSTKPH
jgi:hypothetical protein